MLSDIMKFCSKKTSLIVLLIIFLIPISSFSQKKTEIDSLIKTLSNPRITELKRVDVLNQLSYKFTRTDSAKASDYLNKAKIIADKFHYSLGQANVLHNLGIILTYRNHFSECMLAFNQALRLYNLEKKEKDIGVVYHDIGAAYLIQNKRDEAIQSFLKAEAIHKKIQDYASLIADMNELGVANSQAGNIKTAIQYYLNATALSEQTHMLNTMPQLYINIGRLMYEDKNYNQAKIYFIKAINILKAENEQIDLGIANLNLANVYVDQLNYQQAEISYDNALTAFTKANFTRGIQACYNNMGAVSLRRGKFNEAIPIMEKSLKMSDTFKSYAGVALTKQNVAYAYMKLGDFKKAAQLYDESEEMAFKYKNNSTVLAEIYNHRSMLDSATGNFKNAFMQRNKYLFIKDSLLNEKLSKQINELQIKYETEKKQKQIETLNSQTALQASDLKNQGLVLSKNKLEIDNQQLDLDKNKLKLNNQQLELGTQQSLLKQQKLETDSRGQKIKLLNNQNTIQKLEITKRNTTIIIIAILFLVASLLGYQFYSSYKFKQEARLQTELLNQQTLAAKGIIDAEERERQRIALELHDGVGQLFTTVKMNMEILMERFLVKQPDANLLAEKTMAMVDESCIEVRSIAHQMMPNAIIKSGLVSALRDFINKIPSDKLKISLETKGIDKQLESTTETVLYRVIQESVNNVIKHANATSLDILLLCDEKEITVSIEDNGRGFDTTDKSKFTGIGLKNMISRVEYLKGSVDISSSLEKGTLVAIFIPLV